MQEHPDARRYRVKTVPSYYKLCVIYGQDLFDKIHSRLDQNMGPDIEASGLIGRISLTLLHAMFVHLKM